jgi:TatD DNase family protein
MIDVHCHLEQKDYDGDRDDVIKACRKELLAVISSCADPRDWPITLEMAKKYKGFVFATAGIHPEYIKDIGKGEISKFMEIIKKEVKEGNIVAIGEIGLDYYWIKESLWREKQKELMIQFIRLSQELSMPLVIHSRDAMDDTIYILEKYKVKNALLHLFGERKLLPRVLENDWSISVGPIIKRSKDHKKIIRDMPLNRIMLETDSPWFGDGKRNSPLAIKEVAEKIAEVKKVPFEDVWNQCALNAIKFFNLPLKI